MRLGRHGSISSSELELIIARNGNFLSVRRDGGGAGLYNSMTGEYLGGIGGGRLPEYSRVLQPKYDCDCTPGGFCRSGTHGLLLVRGWRNILYEFLAKRIVTPSKEIRRVLGEEETRRALDYGMSQAPMGNPEAPQAYSSI